MSRRRFLAAATTALAAPMLVLARRSRASTGVRELSFLHTHTGEALAIRYGAGDDYIAAALERVNWLLRDFRTGEVSTIDPLLLDQLHTLATITRTKAPFQVISGYRSPLTNAALQERGRGVAAHSLHMEGRAIDIRLADVPLPELRDAALSLRAGGVGFYRQSHFVHVDTGAVRRW